MKATDFIPPGAMRKIKTKALKSALKQKYIWMPISLESLPPYLAKEIKELHQID